MTSRVDFITSANIQNENESIISNQAMCICTEIMGHLEEVQELLVPRRYKPSPGCLFTADWTRNSFHWPKKVESSDGLLEDDPALMTVDTKYWSIHDVQRYFVGEMHCEKVLFTYQYPNLRLPTKLGRYFWKSNTALKLPPKLYMKELHSSLEITLKKIEAQQRQMNRLFICDQLIKLHRLDYFRRKTFFRILLNILSFQDNLEMVSFENLCATRLEGVQLIQQLACFNSKTLRYLFLWRFVQTNENPLLINYSYITGSGQYIPRPTTKHCFTRSLGVLKCLKVLALEYSHLADGTGAALLSLLPIMTKPHFRLQLVCREDQTPGKTDAALGVGGYFIPDAAWRKVNISCPDLYLLLAFVRVRDYDNMIRFMAYSMPIREIHVQLGIDLTQTQRQDSDISCIIRLMSYRYANTLRTLSIHQWRSALFPLRRVFEVMPYLVRFYYTGRVSDEVDLKRLLNFVSCGVCDKLRKLKIQIQTEECNEEYWASSVPSLQKQYCEIMKVYDIDFCLCIYKS